jgi:hypothetical protein
VLIIFLIALVRYLRLCTIFIPYSAINRILEATFPKAALSKPLHHDRNAVAGLLRIASIETLNKVGGKKNVWVDDV